MDIATLIGIVGALGLIVGAIATGGGLAGFIDIPSIVIVVGGTVMVAFITAPLKVVLGSMKVGMKAFFSSSPDPSENIRKLLELSETARRESLIALEKVSVPDAFMARGIMLIADGTEENLVRSVMQLDIDNMKTRHRRGMGVFKSMGTYAPAMGMIGTLVGLVQMLQNLDDPSSIGPAMAVALLTTFYGAVLSNVIFLPISNKLEQRSIEEANFMEITVEGVIGILNGEHPNILKEKLASFLEPKMRDGN
ncbi:MAG: motility protein A [Desulfovibrio sp.]|nr:MAG: motility protein A [Desulfovibrio sp.]